jgi:hypothetical protein
MAITIQNIPKIAQENPQLGEALTQVQQYVNTNTTQTAGNRKSPPTFVNPTRPPG